jgi:hypothetical protein
LSFLISHDKDIDQFKEPKRSKFSRAVEPAKYDREETFDQEARKKITGWSEEVETASDDADRNFFAYSGVRRQS